MGPIGLRDNRRRARTMITTIWIFVFLNIFCALLCVWALYYNYELLPDSRYVSLGRLTDKAFSIWETFHALFNIFAAVIFIRWFYRANMNRRLIAGEKGCSKFLVIFSWFIPIASWFLPYRIMKRLFGKTLETLQQQPDLRVVNHWWTWWLILAADGYVNIYLSEFSLYREDHNLMCYLKIASMLIALMVDWTTIRLIRTYSKLEAQLAVRHSHVLTEDTPELIDRI